MRLAVYLDIPYRRDADGYSTDKSVVRFVLALRNHFEELSLLGRVDPVPGRFPYALSDDVGFVPLPWYESVWSLPAVSRALPGTLVSARRAFADVDCAWILGPGPVSVPLVPVALAGRKRVVLGVRQDYRAYVRHRLPGSRRHPAVPASYALEGAFRTFARRLPVVVVGADLARRYARGSPLFELAVSLVPGELIEEPAGERFLIEPRRPVELLSVGRLDREKSPELLLEMLDLLETADERRWRLTIVGDGPLDEALRAEAGRFGPSVRFLGHVPNGPDLFRLYRESDVFVHVARTEGLPQVLLEAQSFALPVVGTDVGGVRAALGKGSRGMLVPPGRPRDLASAVSELAADEGLRARLARAGLEHARSLSLERQTARLASFLKGPGGGAAG